MVGVSAGFLWLLKQVFPPACPLCLQTFPAHWSEPFCASCQAGFQPLPSAHCPRCSLPYPTAFGSPHLCGRCIRKTPPFTKVHAVGLYQQSLRKAIHQYKFNGKISLDRPLGRLLDEEIGASLDVDLIIPVPLSRIRLQQRSYNQALLLARELARSRRLPVAVDRLLKVSETATQQGLSARERERNLLGSFRLQTPLQGERVLLVDDVMTTGATAAACSRQLLEGGAAMVEIAVIGRATADL